jgi:hypothetical protein
VEILYTLPFIYTKIDPFYWIFYAKAQGLKIDDFYNSIITTLAITILILN